MARKVKNLRLRLWFRDSEGFGFCDWFPEQLGLDSGNSRNYILSVLEHSGKAGIYGSEQSEPQYRAYEVQQNIKGEWVRVRHEVA
jgi:hypothetical protein